MNKNKKCEHCGAIVDQIGYAPKHKIFICTNCAIELGYGKAIRITKDLIGKIEKKPS